MPSKTNNENRIEFAKVLAMLAASYPRYKLTPDTTDVYFQLLADIPLETLRAAAVYCATNKDFFPSVHELRLAVAEMDRRANGVPSAYEAWQDLKKAGPGSRREVVEEDGTFYLQDVPYQWIHPLVRLVAEQLGWPSEFPGDNPAADRAHFFKAYENALAELTGDQIMLPSVREYIENRRDELLPEGKRDGPRQLTDYIKSL